MTERPPSPGIHSVSSDANAEGQQRVIVTTTQLATHLGDTLGYCPDEDRLNEILMELDRGEYVEWVTVTRSGDYAWDVTDSPDRIADAVAEAVVARFTAWLEN